MGNDTIQTSYLKKPNGEKVHTHDEKEAAFREIWEDVFSGGDEGEGDPENNERIEEYVRDNILRTRPQEHPHQYPYKTQVNL